MIESSISIEFLQYHLAYLPMPTYGGPYWIPLAHHSELSPLPYLQTLEPECPNGTIPKHQCFTSRKHLQQRHFGMLEFVSEVVWSGGPHSVICPAREIYFSGFPMRNFCCDMALPGFLLSLQRAPMRIWTVEADFATQRQAPPQRFGSTNTATYTHLNLSKSNRPCIERFHRRNL